MRPNEHERINAAVWQWLSAKEVQAQRSQAGGKAQGGTRSQVTAGAHMRGINSLIVDEIRATGATGLELRQARNAVLAGWYRASKAWDLLVLQHGKPILAVEYKSMAGSVGNNLNNRADEVFGIAEDARQAEAHGVLPLNLRRAYIYMLEITPRAQRPVGVGNAIGNPDPIFIGASYLDRVAIMCERMRDAGLYHLTWVLGVTRSPLGFMEPAPAVGWDRFAYDLREGFAKGEARRAPHP
ncbi:MAG: PaeR7I family type II restriction endonuclease [Streptosporangiaceae bacterium]